MAQINDALLVASTRFLRSADRILNPVRPWPGYARAEIKRVGSQSVVVGNQFAKAIALRPTYFAKRWNGSVVPEARKLWRLSREAGALLGLADWYWRC